MPRSYTLVTAQFGDLYWIKTLLSHVDRYSDHRVERVVILNQDRYPRPELVQLPRVSDVLEFPLDDEQFGLLGHDHPASIDRALAHLDFDTSHVMVIDSDCFPIRAGWLDQIADVTLAGDPAKWGLTHPCFMVFPVDAIANISFSEGLQEVGLDTGRLIGLQLAQAGRRVVVDPATRSFNGFAGWTYLDGAIYHHGSGSFASTSSPWMKAQVDPRIELWLRSRINRDQYNLRGWEIAEFVLMRGAWKIRRALRTATD